VLGTRVRPVRFASRACVDVLDVVFPRGLVEESLVLRRVFCAADNSAEDFFYFISDSTVEIVPEWVRELNGRQVFL
jgi:hypothetical protein